MAHFELCESVILGKIEIVKSILEQKTINPNFILNGYSPLGLATELKDTEMIKILTQYGAYPEESRFSPLHLAVASENEDNVKYFLDRGAFINDVYFRNGLTPLFLAVSLKKINIAELLLTKGADPNVCNADKVSPLHLAVRSKQKDIINLLINNGAAINQEDGYGCTPLIIASSEGDVEIVEYLLDQGADIDYVSRKVATALICAVRSRNVDTVRLLLDKGANVDLSFTFNGQKYTTVDFLKACDVDVRSVSFVVLLTQKILTRV
ncbi:ORF-8 [Teiidae poxvirus 1]|nr:ORF-8 [Teiidae poxvirus 1]